MTTIYRENANRLSVADAKRLILETLPPEKSAEIYARVDENGDIDFDGPVGVREVHGVQIYAGFIDRDFLSVCEQLSIQPRMKYRPMLTGYTWKSSVDDTLYTITHNEFESLAGLFGLLVMTGEAPERQATTPSPAPVVTKQAGSDAKPWLTHDPRDPDPEQPWYTPARYFARQLAIEKPTLLANRELLADKVSTALYNAGIKKRGGQKKFDSATVLKAFVNVTLG